MRRETTHKLILQRTRMPSAIQNKKHVQKETDPDVCFFHQFEFEICLLLKPVVIQKHHIESLLPLQWDYYLLMAKICRKKTKTIHPLQESYLKNSVYFYHHMFVFLFPTSHVCFFSTLPKKTKPLEVSPPDKKRITFLLLTGMRAIIVTCSPTG